MGRMNKHGLSDEIPGPRKRIIRQRAGFGCVICGLAFGTYHHFSPKFEDARDHDPDGIVFLCAGCHGRADVGWICEETVRFHAVNPKPLEQGFSFGPFDMRGERLRFTLGAWSPSIVEIFSALMAVPFFGSIHRKLKVHLSVSMPI